MVVKLIKKMIPNKIKLRIKTLLGIKNVNRVVVFIEPHEYRIGCDQIGNSIQFTDKIIRVCCPSGEPNKSSFFRIEYDDVNEGLKNANKRAEEIINQHKSGVSGQCEGCGYLIKKNYPVYINNHLNTSVVFSGGFKGDLCNVNCIYCNYTSVMGDRSPNVGIMDVLQVLINSKKNSCFEINFAGGEFFARKDAEEILNYLIDKNVRISVTTNASVRREGFIKLLVNNKVNYINVSLDCGSQETYKKVKERDFYNRVLDNLNEWSKFNVQIYLKYIFIPNVNDNQIDILGFVNVCKQLNASVTISANSYNINEQLPSHTLEAAKYLYNEILKNKLPVSFTLALFNEHDRNLISSFIR